MPIFYNFFSQDSQVAIHSDDAFAPVAFLKLKTITLRDKKVMLTPIFVLARVRFLAA